MQDGFSTLSAYVRCEMCVQQVRFELDIILHICLHLPKFLPLVIYNVYLVTSDYRGVAAAKI